MRHLLLATGFAREVAVAARPGVVAVAGGGDAARLEARLEAAAAGAIGVVSFGLAGALADDLAIGDWIVATHLTGAIEADCDPAWAAAARGRLGARGGAAYADGRMIAAPADKRALAIRTGAVIVDMESHVAARVALRHRLPFAIIRAVSDRADRALPPAIAVSMAADGGLALGAILRSIARRPGQLPALLAMMADAGRGYRALFDGNRRLGPGLGFPDFGELALDMA